MPVQCFQIHDFHPSHLFCFLGLLVNLAYCLPVSTPITTLVQLPMKSLQSWYSWQRHYSYCIITLLKPSAGPPRCQSLIVSTRPTQVSKPDSLYQAHPEVPKPDSLYLAHQVSRPDSLYPSHPQYSPQSTICHSCSTKNIEILYKKLCSKLPDSVADCLTP